ncbi:MAG: DUF2139 domain-containing protein [Sulfolobales archaeon]
MANISILELVPKTFTPKYGPEWGSGGIFGLKYYKGVLYFTLAFEAESFFVERECIQKYKFDLVGPQPVSGGDTYGAVETVDDKIYFGGWVHAPAIYGERGASGSTILFNNKFSHVHEYDLRDRRVRLLWKESLRDPERWVGEISEIIYDPVSTQLLLARADGHENLGIYMLDPRSGEINRLSSRPALKGSIYLDYACFDISKFDGIEGFQCLDITSKKLYYYEIEDLNRISIDGDGSPIYSMGSAIEGYGRYFAFIRSGLIVGNPVEPIYDGMYFVRLFDYGISGLSPRRSNSITVGGGILVAYSAYVESAYHVDNLELTRRLNYITSPTVLVYISPPVARIVGVLGARVTSLERVGDKILVGYSTTANLGGRDAALVDAGVRGITMLDESIITRQSPPYSARIPIREILDRTFGGVPLYGYREKYLTIYSNKDLVLQINEYDVGLPPQFYGREYVRVKAGREVIDLGGYRHIVSFKLHEGGGEGLIIVDLY